MEENIKASFISENAAIIIKQVDQQFKKCMISMIPCPVFSLWGSSFGSGVAETGPTTQRCDYQVILNATERV